MFASQVARETQYPELTGLSAAVERSARPQAYSNRLVLLVGRRLVAPDGILKSVC